MPRTTSLSRVYAVKMYMWCDSICKLHKVNNQITIKTPGYTMLPLDHPTHEPSAECHSYVPPSELYVCVPAAATLTHN